MALGQAGLWGGCLGLVGTDVRVGVVRVHDGPGIQLGGVFVAAGELPIHGQLFPVLEGSYGHARQAHRQQDAPG